MSRWLEQHAGVGGRKTAAAVKLTPFAPRVDRERADHVGGRGRQAPDGDPRNDTTRVCRRDVSAFPLRDYQPLARSIRSLYCRLVR